MDLSTSPSVYLEVVGTAAIKDECGSFGPMLTNPIITLPPNVLSTYVPPSYSLGSTYTDPNVQNGPEGFVGRAEPLKIADLQCPTFGLGVGTSADGSVHTTVGPPWLPIIIPPPQVFTLDPTWESICTDLASYYVFESFAIFDPPFALAQKSYLVPPSPAAPSPKLKGPPNIPANPTAAYDPPATYLPDLSDASSSPAQSVVPLAGDSPTPQESPANAAQPAAVPFDPAAKPTATADLTSKSSLEPQRGDSAQSASSGFGSFILNALQKSDPQLGGSGNADPTHIIPVPASGTAKVTLGGQILSINPSGVYLSGTSYSPEGPPITFPGGGLFSLVSTSPVREESTPDEDPPTNDQPFIPSVQTIAGHTVVSNTSGVYVAGSSLSPGGSPITASNTVISLSPAGTLVIGSSSLALSLADTQTTYSKTFNVGGTIQAEPSAAVIDGITFTPGGPGIEIKGNSVSLEQGGTLVIGTSRLVLPNAAEPTPTAFNLNGMTVQLASSSAVLIDGTTLTPGAPGISVHGTHVSLQHDRTLDVGPSRIGLSSLAADAAAAAAHETPPPGNAFILDGMTVQPLHSAAAAAVNGVPLTLIPGQPGATIINGSNVNLNEPSGAESDVIGGNRVAVLTGSVVSSVNGTSSATTTISSETFEGGAQGKGRRVPPSRMLGFVAVGVIVVGFWI